MKFREEKLSCMIPSSMNITPGSIVCMYREDSVAIAYYRKSELFRNSELLNKKSKFQVEWIKYFLGKGPVTLTYLGLEKVRGLLYNRGLGGITTESLSSKWMLPDNTIVYMHWTSDSWKRIEDHPAKFFRVIT